MAEHKVLEGYGDKDGKNWLEDENFIEARRRCNEALKFIPLRKMKQPFKLEEYEKRTENKDEIGI